MKYPVKKGDVVLLKNVKTSTGIDVSGETATVVYTNTPGNIYYARLCSWNSFVPTVVANRDNMLVLSKEEYPEYYI